MALRLFRRARRGDDKDEAAQKEAVQQPTADLAPRAMAERKALLEFLGIDADGMTEGDLSEATYLTCIKVLSEGIAKMPLRVIRRDEEVGVDIQRGHPLYRMLNIRPNPYMTPTTFWTAMEQDKHHYGNAYALISGFGKGTTLWPLDPERMQVWYDDATILSDDPKVWYLYSAGDKTYKFGSDEVLHLKSSFTIGGLVGVPVREYLKATLKGASKSQGLLNTMYDNGFTTKAVLNYTGSLDDDLTKRLVKNVSEYTRGDLKEEGIDNIIPMPVGFSITPMSMKLADEQFLEVRQYSASQIAAAFGVKPNQYNDLTKASYASASAQQLTFYVDTLLVNIKADEEELKYKLLTEREWSKGYAVEFDADVVLRTDQEKQMNTYRGYVEAGILARAEVRARLGYKRMPGAERLLCNGTNIPVEMAGIQYADGPQEAEPPEPAGDGQTEGGDNDDEGSEN